MQDWKAGKFSVTQTDIRFLTGLCVLCFGLLSQMPFAKGLPIGGITAVGKITLNGDNIIDSFDSSNPANSLWHSNWWFQGHNFGTYTNVYRTDQVVIGTDTTNITLNNDLVYGFLDTGPGGVAVLRGVYTSVGDLAWIGTNAALGIGLPLNTGIQPGHQRADMNVVFNDVLGPFPTNSLYNFSTGYPSGRWLSPGYFPSGTNIGGNTYYYLVTNVNGLITSPSNKVYYWLDGFAIPFNQASVFIDASNCVLFLTNGITLKNGNALTLNATNNANVEIFARGTFDTGNGSVNDVYQYAPTFKIYGLPSCTNIVFPGSGNLTAWVYAPEADITFNGGGSNPYDIGGAFTVHSIILKGHFNFHYDQIFATTIPTPPFLYWPPLTNEIIQLGSNASFTIYATGDSPLFYQWFQNQTNPVAADTNLFALSLTNVQFSDAGSYSVIVTNIYGSVTSAPASLIVYSNATPTLTIDPASTNGQFQFDILGVAGLNYSVQASTDLVNWLPLQTNISPFTFIDTNSIAFPQRFYRSVFLQ